MERPPWWTWDLELTPHLMTRMIDREFTEVDLRLMIESAGDVRPSDEPGRWIVDSRLDQRRWYVIVEPEAETKTVVVITAYPPEP